MKFIRKLSKFMLIVITITVLTFGLFWPQGYFYASKYLAYASLFAIIFYFFGLFSREKSKGNIRYDEEEVEYLEAEVVTKDKSKLTRIKYHFHMAEAYLDECDLAEAEKHFERGMKILEEIQEKTEEVKDLEADAITLAVRIKVDRL